MGQVINGGDLMLFLGGTSIAFSTSHKLSISAETVETSSKDNGGKWVAKAVRKLSWNMSTENLYSLEGAGKTYDDLFTMMTGRTEIDAIFTVEKDYATKADAVPETGWLPMTTGQYKGENKLKVKLVRNIPGYRVYDRLQHMARNNSYYRIGDNNWNVKLAKNIADFMFE